MTDNEIINKIIKALECCLLSNEQQESRCEDCPMEVSHAICQELLAFYALDLIKRQKAEIEGLSIQLEVTRDNLGDTREELQNLEVLNESLGKDVDVKLKYIYELENRINIAKAEAIKEFAERLKERKRLHYDYYANVGFRFVTIDDIDNLVKEMTKVIKE